MLDTAKTISEMKRKKNNISMPSFTTLGILETKKVTAV